jgi:diguanylate cyclase (GGDEF)-like protein
VGTRFVSVPSIGSSLLASPRAVSVEDMTTEPFAAELRERGLSWKSFIGVRLMVGHVAHGLLVFLSNEVRTPPFEQADRDFIDLMATVIASAIGRAQLQEELKKMAFHDTLTGLANRALLEEHLARAIAQSQRTKELVAVHYLDLNRFKPVNDHYGHAAGDAVLVEAAQRFLAAVRAHDIVARIGGDEFVVLQTGIREEEPVRLLAARLRETMKAPFDLPGLQQVSVGVSVGTAISPRDGQDAAGLLRVADSAMYYEKEARRKAV